MNNSALSSAHPIVINWHVTEACNFTCQYCYAKWQKPHRRDLIRDKAATKALLDSLYLRFHSELAKTRPRLNFAGGEPLLHASLLLEAARYARSIGFDVSLITNGSRLDESLTADLAPTLSMLGLSIDSAAPEVQAAIGRSDRRGRCLDLDMLAEQVHLAKRVNPTLTIKINTVVCSANWEDDLSSLIRRFAPQRWKVLRMLPAVGGDLEATDSQFQAYVARHSALSNLMTVEDNGDMQGSYIMIDPTGRFFQNRPDAQGYDYSAPILEAGAEKAFTQIGWSAVKFERRYTNLEARGAA